jgi:hypothetical protein
MTIRSLAKHFSMIRGGSGAATTPSSSHLRHARFSRFVTSTKLLCWFYIQLGTLIVADRHGFFAAALAHALIRRAGILDPTHETFREYERVVDPTYLEQIRSEAKQFSTKRLSRQSRLAECAIRNFKKGKNTIRLRSLRKLIRAIHHLQNKNPETL